ncbi:EamA family transporter [Oceanobacillus picturae]|uniref:EamA family transporter n=1 Tax=Oceanobacillus picturae TaxID=171693 RepID=UPI000E68A3DC|nr:DMT family transporter [Oceanobacillus picturae]RIU94741.1 DMT family transporter [Oceanobacillus picturae]
MSIKGVVLVLIGAASFGFTPVFVKTGFANGYSLGQLNLVQMFIALLLLWSVTLVKRMKVSRISKRDILKVLATGTTVGLTSIFYYGALQYLTASIAIILLFQFVWIGMIYERIFNGTKPTKMNYMSLLVTLLGVFFASDIIGGELIDISTTGLILGLLSGVAYAGFIFFSGQVAVEQPPLIKSTWMVTGSFILVCVVFFQDIPSVDPLDSRLWLIGAGVALVGSVIPSSFFAGGAPLISGRLANILSSIELPVAIVSAMIILSESVSFTQWVGVLLIIAAIFINELKKPTA